MHVALVVGRYSRFFLCARPQAQGAQRSCLEIILCFSCMLEVLLLSILVVWVSSQLGNRDVPERTKRFGVGYEKRFSYQTAGTIQKKFTPPALVPVSLHPRNKDHGPVPDVFRLLEFAMHKGNSTTNSVQDDCESRTQEIVNRGPHIEHLHVDSFLRIRLQ